MGEGFRVDLPALHAAVEGIHATVDQVAALPLDAAGAAAGHVRLGAALDDFAVRWRTGVDSLTADGSALADRLAAAEAAYRSVDASAAGTLTRPSGPDPAAHRPPPRAPR